MTGAATFGYAAVRVAKVAVDLDLILATLPPGRSRDVVEAAARSVREVARSLDDEAAVLARCGE